MRIVPLGPETMDVFAEMARRTPPLSMCWCQYWRLRSKDFGALKVPELRARLATQATSREPPGLVALEPLEAAPYLSGAQERAVGWMGLGPIASFERIVRSKVIPRVDDRPVWSIVCFAVSPSARGRGVGTALLQTAIEHARERGAVALEAYPILVEPGASIAPEFAFTGTLAMFERAGFAVVADRASDPSSRYRRLVVRREL